jgi:hypothetical protein
MEKPMIVILVEGGVVQSVVSESSEVTYHLIDLDVDSNDPIVSYGAKATQVADVREYIKEIITDVNVERPTDGEEIMPTKQE